MLLWLVVATPFTIVGLVFIAIGLALREVVFGAIGAGSLVIGLGAIGLALRFRRRARRIRETGRKMRARVLGVERNAMIKLNDEPAWRIAAEWRDPLTGEVSSGLGENMAFDPAPWLGPEIDVFVDQQDPKAYVVDIEPIRAARRGARAAGV